MKRQKIEFEQKQKKILSYILFSAFISMGLIFPSDFSEASRQPNQETSKGGTRSPQNPTNQGLNLINAGNPRSHSSMVNQFLSNPSSLGDLKDTIVNGKDIDFENGTQLTWPPLPRAWLEYSSTGYVSSNTYLGFKATPNLFIFESTVASKLSFDFRYQVKSSFVAIVARGSRSPNETNQSKLFEYDNKAMKTFLRTSDNPLVGICVYEVLFAYEKGTSMSFDLVGSGKALNAGLIETITHTHFSSFFQIESVAVSPNSKSRRSRMSIDQYQHSCATHYKERIAPNVNADFSKQIMQFVFHNHPKSQCKPTLNEIHPEGDPGCLNWFQKNINSHIRNITIPRCTLQTGGVHRCTLTAKIDGVSCPVYLDENGHMSDKRRSFESRRISTRNIYFPNFSCDEKLGLTCQVTREPRFLGKVLIRNAHARCAKKSN